MTIIGLYDGGDMRIAICDDNIVLHDDLKKHLDVYAKKRDLVMVYYDHTRGSELLASDIEYDLIYLRER